MAVRRALCLFLLFRRDFLENILKVKKHLTKERKNEIAFYKNTV